MEWWPSDRYLHLVSFISTCIVGTKPKFIKIVSIVFNGRKIVRFLRSQFFEIADFGSVFATIQWLHPKMMLRKVYDLQTS